jgi:hypothetical protein
MGTMNGSQATMKGPAHPPRTGAADDTSDVPETVFRMMEHYGQRMRIW